jgi:hypothetical protein
VVDLADLELVSQFRWWAKPGRHATYVVTQAGHKSPEVFLHRLIMGPPVRVKVDHIDHDGLNNSRSNLRLATDSQNRGNSRNLHGGSSQYKGVAWIKSERCWRAYIRVNNKATTLGRFAVEEDAARAYDAAALAAWGEFACPNFPREDAA